MNQVYAASCSDYEPSHVQAAVDMLVAESGGVQAFVPKDAKVFIKVNLVRKNAEQPIRRLLLR